MPIKKIIIPILRVILYPLVILTSPIFYLAAKTGIGIPWCRRLKFHPLAVHFYQPIPEYEEIPNTFFQTKQSFPGFKIDDTTIRQTLERLSLYSDECVWPEQPDTPSTYYAQNPHFGYSSACVLHSLIRAYNTKNIVEIGSGFSTMISMGALTKNYTENDYSLTCIEPYPNAAIQKMVQNNQGTMRLLTAKAEEVNPEHYLNLNANDILFIDSSHVSKLNSDVNFLYLNILPRLKKDVIIHIHDIYIPYEYPREHFFSRQKIFWNEQYFLQAFLTGNSAFEIILPNYYTQKDLSQDFQLAFRHYNPLTHRKSSSIWLRKIM